MNDTSKPRYSNGLDTPAWSTARSERGQRIRTFRSRWCAQAITGGLVDRECSFHCIVNCENCNIRSPKFRFLVYFFLSSFYPLLEEKVGIVLLSGSEDGLESELSRRFEVP